MSELKTIENDKSVETFLNCVENQQRAADTRLIVEMMERITGHPPKMWGDSIIGFDRFQYKRRDGSQHAYLITGLSPRKTSLTVYFMEGFGKYADQMAKLGKHKHSASCLYIGKLSTVDLEVLEEMLVDSVIVMRNKYHV